MTVARFTGDGGPVAAGDEERGDLLEKETTVQDAIFGVSVQQLSQLSIFCVLHNPSLERTG